MERIPHNPFARYGAAVVCVALATLARVPLQPLVGDSVPFITYFFAVMVAAWLGGLGPGLLAAALAAAAADYFFMNPRFSLSAGGPRGVVALGLFVIFSAAIAAVCETMRRERRRAEVLASIVNSSEDAIVGKTLDGTITSWNGGAEHLYGYRADEVIGRNISLLIPPACTDDLLSILNRIRRGERVEHFETLRRRKDGGEVIVSLSVSPILDEKGRVAGASAIARDVTAPRRAEQRLREAEERSLRAQREAKVGTWEWDLRTGGVVWSSGIYELLGLEQGGEGTRIESFERHVHPDDLARAREAVAAAVEGGATEFYDEFRVVRGDREVRWLATKARIVRGEDGQGLRLVGVNFDISERKRAEEESERSRRLFEKIAETTPDILYLFDIEERRNVYANHGAERVLGYTPDQIRALGDRVLQTLVHPDDLGALRALGEQLASASDGAVLECEYRMRRADGEYRWLHGRNIVFARGADGRPRQVLGLSHDVTEGKRAAELLRESEERFRLAATSEAITLFEHDRDLRYLWIYPRHPEHYANACGKTDAELLAPDEAEALTALKQRVVETGAGVREEVRVTLPSGVRWYDMLMEPRLDAGGRVAGVAGIAFDVTARKKVEEEREALLLSEREARAQAEAASRLKDEFLATVSHELRTPLTAIQGWATLLRSGQLDEAGVAHAYEVIERNARAQKQIIADLLDVSRIISGRMLLEVGRFDLGTVVRAAVESVRLAAESKGVVLSAVIAPGACRVNGDADRVQQVVWNLLSNAVKFTPTGGSVEVRLERDGADAVVTVEDNGAGISPDFLPYVFDRFRQADQTTTRRHGGLGLGLSIVRHLVELHGGEVRAQSGGVGRGAAFTVRLPLASPAPAGDGADGDGAGQRTGDADGRPGARQPPALEGLRVLVVDDEEDALDMVARMLAQAGARVVTACSTAEALAEVSRADFDLLVSDIAMPGEDGYALVRRLRAGEAGRGRRTPAVALTAYARDEDRVRALAAGFQDHVAKPVERDDLIAAAACLCGRVAPA